MTLYDSDIEAVLGGAPEPEPAPTVTAAELSEWLNLSPARIHALAREGVIPREGGRFDLRPAIRAYVEHLRAGQKGRQSTDPELNAQKLRLAKANARKIELHNMRAEGTMVEAADVEREWAAILRDLRAAFLALPSRAASTLGHLTPHDLSALDAEVRDILRELAND